MIDKSSIKQVKVKVGDKEYTYSKVVIRKDERKRVYGVAIKEIIFNCPIDLIKPNKWNPNVQSDFQFSKTVTSLQKNGFVANLVVREIRKDGKFLYFELLDGEHRLRAARTLGMQTVPCNNLGEISDLQAKKLSLILAANRGELDPTKLSQLVVELERKLTFDDFSEIPFDDEEIENMKKYFDISWKDIDIGNVFKIIDSNRKEHKRESDTRKRTRLSMKVPKELKEVVIAAIDRLAVEYKIVGDSHDDIRGNAIMAVLFEKYPEIKPRGLNIRTGEIEHEITENENGNDKTE